MLYFPSPEEKLTYPEAIEAVETTFAEHCMGRVQMPPKIYVTLEKGDFRTMPAYLPASGIAGVKVVNVHPQNRAAGLPSVIALTIILDVDTGVPKAILNATALTDIRTGAAGAVATMHLAQSDARTLGLVGSGRQAMAQMKAITAVREIDEVLVWSRDIARAEMFAADNTDQNCRAAPLEEVCGSEIICTTTPSQAPLVKNEWIRPGAHINAIGADAPGKQELDPELLRRSRIFVDDYEQATHSGEINHPISEGVYDPAELAGTLGEVVCGKKRRENMDDITIFDSTGLAIQDLAVGAIVMKKGGGMELPFL